MRAIQVSSYVSGPLDLRTVSLPTPSPDSNKYLIKIHACGANFFDLLQIRGKYQYQPPLPWISGMEFAGTILATPTSTKHKGRSLASSMGGSHKFKVGDRVFGAQQGAYATHILVEEDRLFPIPQGWGFADAAGLFVTAPTSYCALVVRANTQPGEWVLVHAGAGGVGLCAVQMAKALGATVVATASTERKRQVCRDFGADYVVDYKDKDWPAKVVELCKNNRPKGNGQKGVDVVYDPVGMIEPSLKCVAWNARLLVIGFAGGDIEKIALNRVLLKNVSIVGLFWGAYSNFETETIPKVWDGIFDLIARGKFKGITFTDQHFQGLDSVPRALQALGGRETWGKVVVSLGDNEGEESRSKL
jgi:NADPH2:quinone reductase